MADANVGNITASLRVDLTSWQQGLRQAEQQLAQFAQQITRLTSQLNQFSTAFQQAFSQNQQGLGALPQRAQQASQGFQQFNTTLNQTNQAFTVVNQTVQTFNTHLATTTNTVNNVRQGLQQAQGAASGFGSVWQGALSVAGGLGIVTTISGIVSGLKSLATESLQAAARMESLRAQFTALQGAAQGAITLQGLFQTAQRLGVEFGTLATAFRQFDAATRGTALEGDRARRVFEQITTGMRGMGTSSEQVGRALLSLQQMVSKGVVSQEELRQQLGEALPGAMGIAARAFGVTTQEMNKMIEKGMDASQFVLAFGNQVEREFGGKAATATNTLTGAWQRFSNELEQFSGALAGSTLVATLRDLANSATTLLETLRKGREERERAAGGPAPTLPRDAALSPVIQARQTEIDRLAQRIEALQTAQLVPGMGQFFAPMIERLGNERRQLIEAQGKAAAEFQRRLGGEAGAYEGAIDPVQASADRMIKIVEEGQKRLREIDLQGAFLTPLEQAEQKTKAWEETTKKLGDEWNRIGEGLRRTLTPTGKATPFDEIITRLSGEQGMDPNLVRAIIEQESGFNPRAVGTSGEKGLMQLMPQMARAYGAEGREFDPETNIRAGIRLLADLFKQFNGDLVKVLTAYNAGPKAVGRIEPVYAQQVMARIPTEPADIMQQSLRRQEALRLAEEAEKPDTERRAQIMATGREFLRAQEEEERQADAAARERRQQAFATGQEYIRGLDAEIARQDQQMATLTRLAETYGKVKVVRDADTASTLEAALATTVYAEEAKALAAAIREGGERQMRDFLRGMDDQIDQIGMRMGAAGASALEADLARIRRGIAAEVDKLEALAARLEREKVGAPPERQAELESRRTQIAGLIAQREEAEAKAVQERLERDGNRLIEQTQRQLEQMREPKGAQGFPFGPSREVAQLRREVARTDITEDQREVLKFQEQQLVAQDRLNFATEIWYDLSQTIGQSWSDSLMSVIDGTISVSQAFEEMGRAILKTMADIATQMATMALFKLGAGILTGALVGPTAGAEPVGAVGAGINPMMFQHGGVVNAPTLAMVGENPAHNPEVILNRQQMQNMFGRSGSGQQNQVIVNNFPSRKAAEEDAARQRGQGFQVIVNAVLEELSVGESSRINRAMRSLQR